MLFISAKIMFLSQIQGAETEKEEVVQNLPYGAKRE